MDETLLKKGVDYGLIDVGNLAEQVDDMDKQSILEMHSQKVWQGNNGYWYTYIKDFKGERRLVKKKTREELDDAIVSYYRNGVEKPTLKDLFNGWIKMKEEYGELKKQSITRYSDNFQEFYGKVTDRIVKNITDVWLEEYMKKRLVELNPPLRTWNNVKTITRGMFKWGRKRGMVSININDFFNELEISKKVLRKKDIDDSSQVFTDEETSRILEVCKETGDLASLGIELAAYTGLRAGELVSLKYSDFNEDTLNVCRTEVCYREDGKTVYKIQEATKGRDGFRTVILSPEAIDVFKRLKAKRDSITDYIFYDRMHKGAFTNRLYRICEKLNIPKRSLHKLRKTYATKLIDANIPESIITSQIGHTDIKTTRSHYYYDNYDLDEKRKILVGV